MLFRSLHICQFRHLLEILTSTPEISLMLHDIQNVVEVPVLSHKACATSFSTVLVFPEEEGMMQQSSVSISLSF